MRMLRQCLLLCTVCIVMASALAAEEIGQVVALQGRAAAQTSGASPRLLKVDDPLFEGETLRVLPGGELRVRFDDGALLTLAESSALNVSGYNSALGQERFEAELLEGGFRTATGSIAKQAASAYRVSTPFAVLGVRGTDFALGFAGSSASSPVVAGIQEGLIVLENPAGSLVLGANQPFQLAQVSALTAAPQGLTVMPLGLDRFLGLELGPPPGAVGEPSAGSQQTAAPTEGGPPAEGGGPSGGSSGGSPSGASGGASGGSSAGAGGASSGAGASGAGAGGVSAGSAGASASAAGAGAAGAAGAGAAAGAAAAGAIAGVSAATAIAAGLAAVAVAAVAGGEFWGGDAPAGDDGEAGGSTG
ncbi:MAG: FecR family protein, partial [Pseudomonadales bacterium]